MVAVADLVDQAEAALGELARRGEAVEEEWQYVTDLEAAWRQRLEEVRTARGSEATDDAARMAVETAIAETERVEDPHRAIDWLSTFPQVVLLALGEGL